jgi:hypothetical protein
MRAQAVDDPYHLRGVRKVWVRVDWNGDPQKAGFDSSSMQMHLELKLREHSLKVMPADTTHKDGGLHVVLSVARLQFADGMEGQSVAAAINVEFTQAATLDRLKGVSAGATTWGWASVSVGPPDHVKQVIDGAIDRFLNDWYATNQ